MLTRKDDSKRIQAHALGGLIAILKLGDGITHKRLSSRSLSLPKNTAISNEDIQRSKGRTMPSLTHSQVVVFIWYSRYVTLLTSQPSFEPSIHIGSLATARILIS
jgi:hypothetical protein